MSVRSVLVLFLLAWSAPRAIHAEGPDSGATAHLQSHLTRLARVISSTKTPPPAQAPPRLVAQKPGQPYDLGLPPVWVADLGAPLAHQGYVMWESTEAGDLLEFALENAIPSSQSGAFIEDVPALQQFPVEGVTGSVASGCVPTSGASLIGFWNSHDRPGWVAKDQTNPAKHTTLQHHAKRLRTRMRMQEIADTVGYTDNGMTLSGAYPQELARAIELDAAECGIHVEAKLSRFSSDILKQEISAKRPVLLSCLVRLPHKPDLSWGHEVIGVGWIELNGRIFVGIKDNFYPTRKPDTIRWIREEAFQSIIAVQ